MAQAGWLVTGRVALLILFEFTNHPVCAAEERDLLIEAQPPLLGKEGNGLDSTPATFREACPSSGESAVGAVYDRAYFLDSRKSARS